MEDNTPIFVPSELDSIPPDQGSPAPGPGGIPPEPGRPRSWNVACLVAVIVGCVGCVVLGATADSLPGLIYDALNPTVGPIPFPTSTPGPSPTPWPSPTPNATETQLALDSTSTAVAVGATATQAAGWTTLLNETFDNNNNGWRSGHYDSPSTTIDFAVKGGVYGWNATASQSFLYVIPIRTRSLTDFFLSADLRQAGGTPDAQAGLGLREDSGGNHYYFGISESAQEFSFQKWLNGKWSSLLRWTDTPAIRQQGAWNHIAVLAQGSQFYLFINDRLVGQASDDSIANGINLLGVAISQADLHASFEFDNVIVRVPGK